MARARTATWSSGLYRSMSSSRNSVRSSRAEDLEIPAGDASASSVSVRVEREELDEPLGVA